MGDSSPDKPVGGLKRTQSCSQELCDIEQNEEHKIQEPNANFMKKVADKQKEIDSLAETYRLLQQKIRQLNTSLTKSEKKQEDELEVTNKLDSH